MSTETIIRTLALALVLANYILNAMGFDPLGLTESEITAAVTAVATVGASIWAWWKNNSFTANAIKADEYLETLNSAE